MTSKGKNNRGWRRRWIIRGGIILFVGALIAAYCVLTSNWFLQPRIEEELRDRLGVKVLVEDINFGLFKGTDIKRLELIFGSAEGSEKSSSVVIRDCSVKHKFRPLFAGQYEVRLVRVGGLQADVGPALMRWVEKQDFPRIQEERPDLPDVEVADGAVQFRHPSLTSTISLEELGVFLDQFRSGKLSARVNFRIGGSLVVLNLVTTPGKADSSITISADHLDLRSLPSISRSIGPIEANKLSVDGVLKGDLSFNPSAEGWLPFSGRLVLSDVRVNYPEAPFGVKALSGKIDLSGEYISIADLSASMAQGWLSVPHARLRIDKNGIAKAGVHGTARGLDMEMLTDDWFPWSEHAGGDWGSVKSGEVDADFRMNWQKGKDPVYEVDASFREGKVYVDKLGRSLTGLQGRVKVSSSGMLEVKSARMPAFKGQISGAGELVFEKDGVKKPRFEISLDGVRPKPEVAAEISPTIKKVLRDVRMVKPRLDGKVKIRPEEVSCDLLVEAEGVDPRVVDYRIDDLSVDLSWSSKDSKIFFRNLEASRKDGEIGGDFAIYTDRPARLDLALSCRALPIDDRLIALLPEKSRRQVREWKPSGNFGVELHCNKWEVPSKLSLETLEEWRVEAELQDVGFGHEEMPALFSGLRGSVSLEDAALKLSNVRGSALGKSFQVEGVIPFPEAEGSTRLRVASDGMNISPGWLEGIPTDFTETIADLDVSGQCSVTANVTQLPFDDQALEASVAVVLHNLELAPWDKTVTLSGTSRLDIEKKIGEKGRVNGKIRFQQVGVGRLVANHMTGRFDFNGETLRVPSFIIGAYGGNITVNQMAFSPESRKWHVDMKYSHIDLESLVGAFGVEGKEAPGGVLRGTVKVKNEGAGPKDLRGKGRVRIDRGRLYNIPVLLSVFSVLNLNIPRHSPVSDAYGTYEIEEKELKITDLLLSGGDLPVHIEGNLSFEEDKPIQEQPLKLLITIAKTKGVLDSVPVIGWIKSQTIDRLRRFVLQARVKGTLSDYEVSTIADPITRPIKAMWSLLPKVRPDVAEEEGVDVPEEGEVEMPDMEP